jgi:hypothetical protein
VLSELGLLSKQPGSGIKAADDCVRQTARHGLLSYEQNRPMSNTYYLRFAFETDSATSIPFLSSGSEMGSP